MRISSGYQQRGVVENEQQEIAGKVFLKKVVQQDQVALAESITSPNPGTSSGKHIESLQ